MGSLLGAVHAEGDDGEQVTRWSRCHDWKALCFSRPVRKGCRVKVTDVPRMRELLDKDAGVPLARDFTVRTLVIEKGTARVRHE